jgi:predicted RNA-binding protein with PUA-like domain
MLRFGADGDRLLVLVNYWLIKSEPFKYAWDDLVRDGRTYWDGVRNAQARNNLQAMKRGDLCLYYHSNVGKEIVGIAGVVKSAYPDPTTEDPRWVVVDVAPRKPLTRFVPLSELRTHPGTSEMAVVRQSRLSVCPVRPAEFKAILQLGKTKI